MIKMKLETKNGKLYVGEKKVLKGWESFSGWYWFDTELNNDKVHFGLVQGFCDELGYFSERELNDQYPRVWKINDIDLPHAGRREE